MIRNYNDFLYTVKSLHVYTHEYHFFSTSRSFGSCLLRAYECIIQIVKQSPHNILQTIILLVNNVTTIFSVLYLQLVNKKGDILFLSAVLFCFCCCCYLVAFPVQSYLNINIIRIEIWLKGKASISRVSVTQIESRVSLT